MAVTSVAPEWKLPEIAIFTALDLVSSARPADVSLIATRALAPARSAAEPRATTILWWRTVACHVIAMRPGVLGAFSSPMAPFFLSRRPMVGEPLDARTRASQLRVAVLLPPVVEPLEPADPPVGDPPVVDPPEPFEPADCAVTVIERCTVTVNPSDCVAVSVTV